MSELFYNFIVIPLYNVFITLIDTLPFNSVALAVVILTILIKVALFPFAKNMMITQKKMKEIAPKLEELKEKYKDKPHELSIKTMELYKKENIKPFSSILQLLIQIPIILALYWVIMKSGLPNINTEWIYDFVPRPQNINMHFFNISLSEKSAFLAILVAFTQFLYAKYSLSELNPDKDDTSFKADFQRSLNMQMTYVFPIIMAFVSYALSSAVALYFLVSNLFMIAQEYYFRIKGLK